MILGNLLKFYAHRMPYHKGKYRILCLLDSMLGPFPVKNQHLGLRLDIFFSSFMDQTYFLDFQKNNRSEKDALHTLVFEEIQKLRPGDSFLDVGSNIGFFSQLASQKVGSEGRVVAIEPSTREYLRLLGHLRANAVRNVIPLHLALTEKTSIQTLNLPGRHTGANYMGKPERLSDGLRQEKVVALHGSTLLGALFGKTRFHLVKVDVEGAELFVLRGLREFFAENPPARILVEITPEYLQKHGHDSREIYRLMDELGYRPRWGLEHARAGGRLFQYDELFSR